VSCYASSNSKPSDFRVTLFRADASGVRLVVLGEEDRAVDVELAADQVAHRELLAQPLRHGLEERFEAAGFEAILDGASRKPFVVLETAEPLFLRRGDDRAVVEQARRAVMVEGGEAEDGGAHSV